MKVILVSSTPDMVKIVAVAGRVCYSNKSVDELLDNFTNEEIKKMITKLSDSGHLSTMEHGSFVFAVEGISRALSHQLVRHRIASFSQRSMRYIKEKAFNYVTPQTIKDAGLEGDFEDKMAIIQEWYNSYLQRGIPAEDARFLLPQATSTTLVFTFNIRSLINFFEHRLCRRAQWEIRDLAFKMLKLVKDKEPIIGEAVERLSLPCLYKQCKEGSMSCGKPYTIEEVTNKTGIYKKKEEENDGSSEN